MDIETERKRAEGIEQFVDMYWPLTPKALEFVTFCATQSSSLDHREYLKQAGQLDKKYLQEMSARFGEGTIARYRQLARIVRKKNSSSWQIGELDSFVFKEGLSEYVPLKVLLRSRATLAALLEALRDEQPFTLVDCGAGNGKMTAGLAAYLPQIEQVYAVDCNQQAIERVQHNFYEASNFAGRDISLYLQAIEGDYLDTQLMQELHKQLEGKRTIVLFAHAATYAHLECFLTQFITPPRAHERTALICHSTIDYLPPKESMMISMMPAEYWTEALSTWLYQFSIKPIATKEYLCGDRRLEDEVGVFRAERMPDDE